MTWGTCMCKYENLYTEDKVSTVRKGKILVKEENKMDRSRLQRKVHTNPVGTREEGNSVGEGHDASEESEVNWRSHLTSVETS